MKQITENRTIISSYFNWYLIDGPVFLFKAWKNIFLFSFHFFSVSFLLKTLFSYWHRYRWYHEGGINVLKYLEVLFSNFISRFLGAVVRTTIIVFSIIVQIVIIVISILTIIVWLLLPLIMISSFIIALTLIFG